MNKFTYDYEPFRMPEPKFGKIYGNRVLSQSGEVTTNKMEKTFLVSYFDRTLSWLNLPHLNRSVSKNETS